jgi:hypothetical protein
MSTVHNLPATPAFRDERPDSPISEIALRVIVERNDWQFEVVGTATLISGHLAITANHVLEHALRKYGAVQKDNKLIEIDAFELKLWQVLPGPIYRTWKVFAAWPCATDVVILHLGLDRTSLTL